MFDFILKLIPSGVIRAGIMASARHVATAASGVIVTYILAHHGSQTNAQEVSEAVSALILGLVSYGFSLWDVKNVDTKIKQAKEEPAVPPLNDTHYPEFNNVPK